MESRITVFGRVCLAILIVGAACAALGLPLLSAAEPQQGAESAILAYCHGHFVVDADVPGPGDRLIAAIDLTDCAAPPAAKVSRISLRAYFETDFAGTAECANCLGQVDVSVANAAHEALAHASSQDCCGQALLEKRSEADRSTYPCELTVPDLTALNGDSVLGKWFIIAQNGCSVASNYRLLEWEITVYYQTGPVGTPTPTPTPTATPEPFKGCENILPNGSFETGIQEPWWTTGSARVNTQYKHDGTKSVLLVEANDQAGELIAGLDLPEGADSITLRYWWRVQTQDPEPSSGFMNVLVEPEGASHQVARYSGADGPGLWHLEEVDLSPYAGEHTLVVFQGHNGPSYPSKWYVDEVEVEVCGEGWGGLKLFVPLVMKG